MSIRDCLSYCRISLVLAAVLLALNAGTVSAQDKGAPPWGEFLRRFNKDRLLKEPFHMDPEEGVKGLASKIRARELDIPNRKKAIRYLADLDCRVFPEAKQMLLDQLNPETERWEEVRFEAAKGLRDMLERHACNGGSDDKRGGQDCQQCQQCQSSPGLWQQCCNAADRCRNVVTRRDRKNRSKEEETACHCKTCCDANTLNTLARTAYELKENGCCYEPSRRVREMAVEAISVCGIPCNYQPYYADEMGPPPMQEQGQQQQNGGGEVQPDVIREGTPADSTESTRIQLPIQPDLTEVSPISRLSNICIVSLKHGEQRAASPQFQAVWRGRLYYFANEAARAEFEQNPDAYAVAYGGCDPVHYVETRQAIEGRYLTQHEGRFYMFATPENVDVFRSSPEKFAVRSTTGSSQLTAAR